MPEITTSIQKKLNQQGFFYENTSLTEKDFFDYIQTMNIVPQYGKYDVWTIQDESDDAKITHLSKTSLDFTPHIEGVDMANAPRWVVLYGAEESSIEFETYLVDSYTFLDNLSENEQHILRSIDFVFVDIVGHEHKGPVVRTNSDGNEYIHVTSRGYFKPRYGTHSVEMEIYEYQPIIDRLTTFFVDPKNRTTTVSIKKGDLFIFDNLRFLHGRIAQEAEKDMSRKLIRVYAHNNLFKTQT